MEPLKYNQKWCVLCVGCSNTIGYWFGVTGSHVLISHSLPHLKLLPTRPLHWSTNRACVILNHGTLQHIDFSWSFYAKCSQIQYIQPKILAIARTIRVIQMKQTALTIQELEKVELLAISLHILPPSIF